MTLPTAPRIVTWVTAQLNTRAEMQPDAHLLLLPAVALLCDDTLEAAVRFAGHNARLHLGDHFLAVATIRLFLGGNLQRQEGLAG